MRPNLPSTSGYPGGHGAGSLAELRSYVTDECARMMAEQRHWGEQHIDVLTEADLIERLREDIREEIRNEETDDDR